jgi:hypothetical protein
VLNDYPAASVANSEREGGFHGSVYVDAEFEKHIRRVLGDHVIDSMSVSNQLSYSISTYLIIVYV